MKRISQIRAKPHHRLTYSQKHEIFTAPYLMRQYALAYILLFTAPHKKLARELYHVAVQKYPHIHHKQHEKSHAFYF